MKYINNFLKDLKNQNYSNKTIKDYRYILTSFAKYLNQINVSDEKNVTENHFKNYISKYRNIDHHSMYYKTVTITKKYFRYLEESNYIFFSPVERIKNPKQVNKHHLVFNKTEMNNLINNYSGENAFDIRTRAMIELIYSSALRPGECLNLNISCIDYTNKVILIKKTKTKTDRIVPVTNNALYYINKYLQIARKYKKETNKLFVSLHTGKKLTSKGFRNSIKYSVVKKNIKLFSLYSIRATSATHLFENGMSISYLQLLLGHTDLRATTIYVRVSFLNLKKTLESSHPRLKLEYSNERGNEIEISNAS